MPVNVAWRQDYKSYRVYGYRLVLGPSGIYHRKMTPTGESSRHCHTGDVHEKASPDPARCIEDSGRNYRVQWYIHWPWNVLQRAWPAGQQNVHTTNGPFLLTGSCHNS